MGQAAGEKLAAEVDKLKPRLDEAGRVRQKADEQATQARTLRDQAREQAEELRQLRGAKVCRHCGQALTPEHLRDEERRRDKEAAQADKVFQQAASAQEAARKTEQELRDQHDGLARQLQEAREQFRDLRRRADQARQDSERLQRECGQTYHELAEPFRARISPVPCADWLEPTYPTADELAVARGQAAGLIAARQQLRAAEHMRVDWDTLKAQMTSARQGLAALEAELPADRPAVRQEHVRLEAEEQALDRGLRAQRHEVQATQEEMERLARDCDSTRQQLAGLEGRHKGEETTSKLARQTLDRLRKALPVAWQAEADRPGMADLHRLRSEMDTLVGQEAEERGRQLLEARLGLEMLRQQKEALETRQDRFPEAARRDPASLQESVLAARQLQATREEELLQARQHKAQLENCRRQRQKLGQELMEGERAKSHAKLLADLLGRDRLQLHLVRQAERQVVDYANAVLDRLSDGQLYLRLCGEAGGDGMAAKALELEAHNRNTGERPINVAFLSGSQKFRVAVSLALGIGQYASRRHRPIESVIIDEGFGCLDKVGRQAMIQEMQNLRGQLKCILLVSHQEEFADAFTDGYHFELTERSTRATRFQR
jgi:DNA repair exonuclease SbcCD ATPase subunit